MAPARGRYEIRLLHHVPGRDPEVEKITPRGAVAAWRDGEPGYRLMEVRDAVLASKRHFPHGSPPLDDLRWSSQPSRRSWGFYRYSDRSITLNRILNSPDIPLFVVEFVMYHELLHADMPSAGHDQAFRARERLFAPSAGAVADAERRGIRAGQTREFWRVRAAMFLDSFGRHYEFKDPDAEMIL